MHVTNPMLASLRRQIGTIVTLQGKHWTVIDITSDGPELVLENQQAPSIQADQHGHGRRRTAETISIPIFDETGAWHPRLIALGLPPEAQ
jgi:hypothetical protein